MAAHTISRTTLVAVLVATTAALTARAWLQIHLIQGGMQSPVAADLSYLVVPPVLILLLFPLWRTEKAFLANQFRRKDLTWKLALTAIAIGVLIRLLWWSQLIAGASFGVYTSPDPDAIVGPIISFQCGSPGVIFLGFFVMAILVPLIEEIVHRGYIQTALRHRGFIIAVVISSIIFALFHRFSSWPTVFIAGLILGTQYFFTRSLWMSLITHATVNGLIQIDWRCLSVIWNPSLDGHPLLIPGTAALVVMTVSLVTLAILLRRLATGTTNLPR
jgi:membrane protease YdiL (CAAX protease family)